MSSGFLWQLKLGKALWVPKLRPIRGYVLVPGGGPNYR
jgi:hypothetical protein